MIMTALRERTDKQHAQFDPKYEALLFASTTRERYRELLRKLFGFYFPFEARLESLAGWQSLEFSLVMRRKVPFLEKDLLAFGETNEEIQHILLCSDLPKLDTIAQALGCLYVIEGGTLGSEYITPLFKETLQIDERNGAAFFMGYGSGQVKPMWESFCETVIGYTAKYPDVSEEIINAACNAFEKYEQWLLTGVETSAQRLDRSSHSHAHHSHSHSHDTHGHVP